MNQIKAYSRTLSPLVIRGLTIKNRVVRTAHATAFADGPISDQLIAYHMERAQGGVGLTILEGSWVHESSRTWARNIHTWGDEVIPSYQRLMDAINPTGMRVIQQLWHGGGIYADWRAVPVAPSPLPGMLTGVPAREITHAQIRELVEAFAAAAVRCEKGGLHGCEVAGSHGYMVMQFLSPWSNQRTDEYGGSLENRARFVREVLLAIRASVSDSFIVGLRLGPEALEGGLTTDEIVEVVKLLKADGLTDYINMSMGGYHNPESIIPALHAPCGIELDWVRGVRERTGLITFVSGRFRSLDEVEQVIAAGEADMVGMTRATIADPHLVKKTIEQGVDAVRPCIGCNQLCVGNIFTGQLLQCTVNVQVGRESEFPETAIPKVTLSKKVLVVGGGPAGLEAARVAALAGHKVELHEATPDLGGAVKQVKSIPYLAGLADIIYWLQDQVYSLGVDVHTSSYLDADDIVDLNPDVVLLATGSLPREDGWQLVAPRLQLTNLDSPRVIAVPDLMEGRVAVAAGKTVVIVDDTGHAEAAGVAEYLLSKGVVVQFVCRFAEFAPQMNFSWRGRPALRRLNATGRFTLHTQSVLSAVAADGHVEISSIVGEKAKQVAADHLIFVGYNIPQDGLLTELKEAGFVGRVELIGDSASPRYLHAAIHDGYNVASNL
jgi:2,4-dienoyl-CoA reductase-like NADH-dependent reductase (Old Yellow Enzyme family)